MDLDKVQNLNPGSAFPAIAEPVAAVTHRARRAPVHIRIKQRNARKSTTTVEGLNARYKLQKIAREFMRDFCCSGSVHRAEDGSEFIRLQGDQRQNVAGWLVANKLCKESQIKIHGWS